MSNGAGDVISEFYEKQKEKAVQEEQLDLFENTAQEVVQEEVKELTEEELHQLRVDEFMKQHPVIITDTEDGKKSIEGLAKDVTAWSRFDVGMPTCLMLAAGIKEVLIPYAMEEEADNTRVRITNKEDGVFVEVVE